MNAGSSKENTPSWDPFARWFTEPYRHVFEMVTRAAEMSDRTSSDGKPPWQDLFDSWKQFLTAPLPNSQSAAGGIEGLIELSKPWQESLLSFQKAWFSCMESAAAGYPLREGRGKEAANALNAWMKSCGELTGVWVRFADDQAKAFTRFCQVMQTDRKATAKKGQTKKKGKATQ